MDDSPYEFPSSEPELLLVPPPEVPVVPDVLPLEVLSPVVLPLVVLPPVELPDVEPELVLEEPPLLELVAVPSVPSDTVFLTKTVDWISRVIWRSNARATC